MKKKIIILIFVVCLISIFLMFYDTTYEVTFDTDGGEPIKPLSVKKGTTISLPYKAKKENYIFVEWQYQGKKINDKIKIDQNITLKAKYLPKIYAKIMFDTDGGSNVSSMSVLSGFKIDKDSIKDPIKEGYNFEGWYLDGKPYDFQKKVTGNITLKAKYSKAGTFISRDLKVGDLVLITGNYAASTYDIYAPNTKAIGWIRKVLAIHEDGEYKYQVGNEYGTTGFFKINSLKLYKN